MDSNSNKITIITITFFLLFSSSCKQNSKSNRNYNFYNYSRSYDILRIPLIEPYEIISADKGYSWEFTFPYNTLKGKSSLNQINKIGICNSKMLFYSSNTYLLGRNSEAWFVVDTILKKEDFFTNEKDFLIYLKKEKCLNTSLFEINKVFKDFDSLNLLPNTWPIK